MRARTASRGRRPGTALGDAPAGVRRPRSSPYGSEGRGQQKDPGSSQRGPGRFLPQVRGETDTPHWAVLGRTPQLALKGKFGPIIL